MNTLDQHGVQADHSGSGSRSASTLLPREDLAVGVRIGATEEDAAWDVASSALFVACRREDGRFATTMAWVSA